MDRVRRDREPVGDAHDDADVTARRPANLLLGYAAVWIVLGLVPFDFTLRPAELAEKVRAGRITLIPFSNLHGVIDGVLTIAGDALVAAPIGALMATMLAEHEV